MNGEEQRQRERAVVAYYDQLAAVYGTGEYFQARRTAVLAAIASEIGTARSVLDLGCGNGTYTAEFAARQPEARVVGADLSPEMLDAARQRAGEHVALVRADATALPFRAATFNLAFMSHVLLLVADVERCVREVAHALVAGGVLVATVGAGRWRERLGEFLGPDDVRELEALFGAARLRSGADDSHARVGAACAGAGLQQEWRSAAFSVSWAGLEEWVRIRWLTIADDALRERAEHWLAQLRARASERMLPFTETLLVARKPIGT